MLVVSSGSFYEKRLIHEGYVLFRQLRRRVRAAGGDARGPDDEVVKLNHMLGYDVAGLVTLRVCVGPVVATLISAPGAYFHPDRPERRAAIDEIAAARRAQGRCVLVVSKHQALGHVPLDLIEALKGAPSRGPRLVGALLAATGRRPGGAARGGVHAAGVAPDHDVQRPAGEAGGDAAIEVSAGAVA